MGQVLSEVDEINAAAKLPGRRASAVSASPVSQHGGAYDTRAPRAGDHSVLLSRGTTTCTPAEDTVTSVHLSRATTTTTPTEDMASSANLSRGSFSGSFHTQVPQSFHTAVPESFKTILPDSFRVPQNPDAASFLQKRPQQSDKGPVSSSSSSVASQSARQQALKAPPPPGAMISFPVEGPTGSFAVKHADIYGQAGKCTAAGAMVSAASFASSGASKSPTIPVHHKAAATTTRSLSFSSDSATSSGAGYHGAPSVQMKSKVEHRPQPQPVVQAAPAPVQLAPPDASLTALPRASAFGAQAPSFRMSNAPPPPPPRLPRNANQSFTLQPPGPMPGLKPIQEETRGS